eukprot:3077422-Rhodomonas_salina.2
MECLDDCVHLQVSACAMSAALTWHALRTNCESNTRVLRERFCLCKVRYSHPVCRLRSSICPVTRSRSSRG